MFNEPISFKFNGYATTIVGPGPKGVGDKYGENTEESIAFNKFAEQIGE